MKISIMTLFPEMCEAVLSESIVGRAREKGIVEITPVNIRDYTADKHKNVDDATYGGGMGMLMQAQPIFDCYKAICEKSEAEKPHLIYMSPQGKTLTQKRVKELSELDEIVILCGHYEGVDERVLEEIVDEEISVGDYVLTGGELPALIVCDAVSRMIDGVLPNDEAKSLESHYDGLLEYPQYTRPAQWHGKDVPEVLMSGNHEKIDKWRRQQALRRTLKRRPDMLTKAELNSDDIKYIAADTELLNEYLDVLHSSLNEENIKDELVKSWLKAFAKRVPTRIINKNVLAYGNFLWHIFTWGEVRCLEGEAAKKAFDSENYTYAVKFHNGYTDQNGKTLIDDVSSILKTSAKEIDEEWENNCSDIYIVDKDFKWTYVKTHEDSGGIGPFFCKIK